MEQDHRRVVRHVGESEIRVHVDEVGLSADVRVSPSLGQKHFPAGTIRQGGRQTLKGTLTGQGEDRAL